MKKWFERGLGRKTKWRTRSSEAITRVLQERVWAWGSVYMCVCVCVWSDCDFVRGCHRREHPMTHERQADMALPLWTGMHKPHWTDLEFSAHTCTYTHGVLFIWVSPLSRTEPLHIISTQCTINWPEHWWAESGWPPAEQSQCLGCLSDPPGSPRWWVVSCHTLTQRAVHRADGISGTQDSNTQWSWQTDRIYLPLLESIQSFRIKCQRHFCRCLFGVLQLDALLHLASHKHTQTHEN